MTQIIIAAFILQALTRLKCENIAYQDITLYWSLKDKCRTNKAIYDVVMFFSV